MEINTSRQLVIQGDLVDSSVIAVMVEIHGSVRHSKIKGDPEHCADGAVRTQNAVAN